MRWLDSIIDSMDMNLSKLRRQWRTGEPGVLQSMGSQRVGHNLATEQWDKQRSPQGLSTVFQAFGSFFTTIYPLSASLTLSSLLSHHKEKRDIKHHRHRPSTLQTECQPAVSLSSHHVFYLFCSVFFSSPDTPLLLFSQLSTILMNLWGQKFLVDAFSLAGLLCALRSQATGNIYTPPSVGVFTTSLSVFLIFKRQSWIILKYSRLDVKSLQVQVSKCQ